MSYDIIPGVDSSYNFPRVVREALAGSTEIKTAMWLKATPETKGQLDSYITAANSGVYPVAASSRATLGIPAGPASGWLTVIYVYNQAVAQIFSTVDGSEEYRRTYSSSSWSAWQRGTGGASSWYKLRAPTTSAEVDGLLTPEDSGIYPVSKASRVTLGIPAGDASGWLTTVYISTTAVGQRFTSLRGEELQRFYGGPGTGWNAWSAVSGGGGSGSGAVAHTGMEATGEWTTPAQMKAYVAELSKHLEATAVTIGQTVKGVDIPALIIGDKTKPAFLAVGGQHANELGNTHGLMMWARQLLSGRDQILMDMCVLIVPMLNIDSWMGPRPNANGVDLNRDWIAFTQPETKAVRDWIAGFNVIGAVDGHSFGYPREVSMRIPDAGTPAVKAKAQKLYDAIAVAVREDGQFVRNYDVANHPGMMPEGMAALGIPATFTEIPSGYGSLYGDTPKPSPNWQQRMAALTMNAAAHEVWKWTPTYPADLVDTNRQGTGWHDITSTMSITPSSGRLLLRRDRNICRLAFKDLKFSSGSSGLIAVLPEGFRPEFTEANPVSGLSKHAQVTQYGNAQLFGWVAEGLIVGSLSWVTSQPLPATFPGTKL